MIGDRGLVAPVIPTSRPEAHWRHPLHTRKEQFFACRFGRFISPVKLRLYDDLPDHTLYFVESADIAVCTGRPEGMFIGLGRIQVPGIKPLGALRQYNVLGVCRLARIGGYRVYLAR